MSLHPREPRYRIRPAAPADLDEVMAIEDEAFRFPWPRQVFVEEIERDWAYVDVARERAGGPCVGFANYWLVRDEVHLLNVATLASHRRQGVAAALLAHVIEFSRARRCRCITLEVRRSNEAAQRLYRRYGFRAVGVRPHYYAEDREDALVMLLDLP